MTLAAIEAAAGRYGLTTLGAFHPDPGDGAPEHCRTLILLGPGGPAFWRIFRDAPEMQDGARDPLDRWSRRVVGHLADEAGGTALFPFGAPPYQPFQAWAERSRQAWASPVILLVHASAGLFVSYRGALAVRAHLELPPPNARPCDTCAAPCLTACPVGALGADGYDIPRCHAYLDTEAGRDCLDRGCAVRRACPVGQDLRPEAQSAFHMASFHAAALPT